MAPEAGYDVYLTIDARLQQDTYSSVIENIQFVVNSRNDKDNFGDCDAGAAVVSDVNNGEVLADGYLSDL